MDVAIRLGGERLFVWFVVFLGLVVAAGIGFLIGEDSVTTAIVLASGVAALGWIALARRRWWLIVPAASGIGGYFYFGFKFYPHELALLAAFIPLALSVAVRMPGTYQKRTAHFPLAMYLLSFYLTLHWIGSNVYNRLQNDSGFGNVSRAYFNALWVILFVIALWRWGSTKYIREALFICYIAAFLRMLIGLLTYFSESFAYIPVLNYVLPGSTDTRSADLRASALSLAMFAACYFLIHRGFVRKIFHSSVFFCSCTALLFGSGRGVLVLVALIPISTALLYRKVSAIFVSLGGIALIVGVINLNPSILNDAPFSVQRSASVLILDKQTANSFGRTATSDIWHEELRKIGFTKWTKDWNSFLFGTGIRPFDAAMLEQFSGRSATFGDLLASSAKVGAYESGWWTVTAVTGSVGLVSYLLVFSFLLRRLVPIIWKEKVVSPAHAFAFLSVFGIMNWLILGWANGSYPGVEIMYGFIAVCAFVDRVQERNVPRAVVHPTPRLTPTRCRLEMARR